MGMHVFMYSLTPVHAYLHRSSKCLHGETIVDTSKSICAHMFKF